MTDRQITFEHDGHCFEAVQRERPPATPGAVEPHRVVRGQKPAR